MVFVGWGNIFCYISDKGQATDHSIQIEFT